MVFYLTDRNNIEKIHDDQSTLVSRSSYPVLPRMSSSKMDIDDQGTVATTPTTTGSDDKKRFEVKKWNAVALWAWGNARLKNKKNNTIQISLLTIVLFAETT